MQISVSAELASELGKPQEEIDLYAGRAMNYKNVFDTGRGLMRGKNEDGTFQSPFSPYKWGDAFTEGNSWHYTWSVFHDIQGLIDLMGGNENFVAKLDSVFEVPPDLRCLLLWLPNTRNKGNANCQYGQLCTW